MAQSYSSRPGSRPLAGAAGAAGSDDGDFTLSVNVQLVQIPVSVTSKDGKLVDNLPQSSFQVFEDNTQQEITLFKHEDIPLSLGLVIDNSGSMRNKRQRVNSAALNFVRESNPEDETFIVDFDDEAYLRQQFTASMADLVDALRDIDTRGETALNDAIYVSLDHVKTGSRDKKALLVITDGEDNKSKYGINALLTHIRETKDVTIYAIGLLEDNDDRGGLFGKPPSKKAKDDLKQIAELTGGEAYFPKTVDEVADICKTIARDLRNQYTLGYSPKNTKHDGGYRTIRVNVTPPAGVSKPTVRAKPGYTAHLLKFNQGNQTMIQRRGIFTFILITALSGICAAQSVSPDLVFVSATVTGPKKVPAPGLKAENFQLFEDGVEQKITSFAAADGAWTINILLANSMLLQAVRTAYLRESGMRSRRSRRPAIPRQNQS